MLIITGIFLLSTTFVHIHGLFVPNSEISFKYHGVVKAGTLTPAHGSSDWEIKGTLVLQVDADNVTLQFHDCSVSLFNGKKENDADTQQAFMPIPDEAKHLLTPFTISYVNGRIKSLAVSADEPTWSVNIKRALTSVFQLDESNFNLPSFVSKEESLYGQCDVEYTVTKDNNKVLARKFIDYETCQGYPRLIWKNTSPLLCPRGRRIITSTTGRLYVLVPTNDSLNLERVEVNSGVDVQPFHAHGELHYAFVNQTLVLVSKGPINKTASVPIDAKLVSLTYELPGQDVTQGRAPVSDEENLKLVDLYIRKIIESLEVDPSQSQTELIHNQHVPQLLFFLSHVNKPHLEQYYNKLAIGTSYHQETHRNLFLKLLPQVGSDDAILLIQDLVYTGKEKGKIAIELLTVLPFYIRHPSEQLLKQSEILLSLGDDIIDEVKQSAVLTFSIMVYKVCKENCRTETLEKYVRLFMDKFKESRSYSEQVLYLEVLNNIELGSVFDYLLPVIQGNSSVFTEQPHHIRFLGVWATMSRAVYNPHKVSQLYWPILANRSEPLEMRVAALTMLILAKPTHGNFVNLMWFMMSEKNAHLLHFYYTTLQSLIETQYPCYEGLGVLASYIIRYIQPPATRNWATGNYILDYSDPKYGFGGLAQLFAVANQRTGNPNVFYLLINSHALDHNLRQFAIYVKLEGVGDAVRQILFKADNTFFDLVNIFKVIKTPIITPEHVHIEIIAKIEDRVVYCQYINETNFYKLAEVASKLNFLAQEASINYQTIKAPILMEITQPTDLGVPLLLRNEVTVVTSIRGNFTRDANGPPLSRKNEIDLRYSFNSGSNLIIYNPVLDVWHAIRRSVSYQSYLPFISQISVHPEEKEVKISVTNPSGTLRGFTAHATSYVEIRGKGSSKLLRKYCQKCKSRVPLTGSSKRNEINIVNTTIDDLGTNVQASIFDCDHSYSTNDFVKLIQNIFSEENKNYRVLPASQPFLGIIHTLDLLTLVPPKGSCGLQVSVSPAMTENTELILTGSLHNKNHQFKLSLELNSSISQTSLKLWKILLSYDILNENTKYIHQVIVSRSSEGQEWQKVCFNSEIVFPESTKRLLPWTPSKDVTAKASVVWGNSSESCPKDEGEFRIIVRGEVTKEQKDLLNKSRAWPHATCLEDTKNVAEWGHGYTPITEACYRASVEIATLRKYTATMTFNNVPESLLLLRNRIIAIMDTLNPGLISHSVDEYTNLTLTLTVPVSAPHITISVNEKELVLPKVASWLEPFLINTCVDLFVPQAMEFGLLGSCVVNSARVISFDNNTHSFTADSCYTLVAGECTAHPRFAVFVKRTSESRPLAAKIYLNGDIFEILPSNTGELKVSVNNKKLENNEKGHQHPPEEESDNVLKIKKNEKIQDVRVSSDSSYIWLQHNGHFLTLVVPAIYRGQLCGLCGDFNGDGSNDVSEVISFECTS